MPQTEMTKTNIHNLTDEQIQDRFNEILDGLPPDGHPGYGWDWPTIRAVFPDDYDELLGLRAEASRRLRLHGRFLGLTLNH